MGEHLAFASLVASGYAVRLSGEDCGRGTFTHRHAVLHDQKREKWDTGTYVPLHNVADNQAPFVVIDSILSEEAVLGFEYGYASADPNTLVIWEAQFGDFVNGAQVVIDQFIASGEVKWGRANGLTLMLPHGYEGPGPGTQLGAARALHAAGGGHQHADRAADFGQPDLPSAAPPGGAQPFRKPLIILTPKSLLRAKDATSPLSRVHQGRASSTVIGASRSEVDPGKVKRVIACSGKVYYDLVKKREEKGADEVAILRVEQLYPFPHKVFASELRKFPNATEILWCQDEPQNQGAWFFIQHNIHENMVEGQKLGYSGRAASASPAVGYSHLHQEQQKALVEGAFAKLKGFILTK
jgi:2-oxoglutarate dehydrogenase E1 component